MNNMTAEILLDDECIVFKYGDAELVINCKQGKFCKVYDNQLKDIGDINNLSDVFPMLKGILESLTNN